MIQLLAQLCRKSLVQNYVRYFLDEDENSPPPAPPPEKDLEPSKLCPTPSPKKRPAEDPKTPQTPLVNKQKEVMAPAPAPKIRKTGPLKNIPSQVQGLSGEFLLFCWNIRLETLLGHKIARCQTLAKTCKMSRPSSVCQWFLLLLLLLFFFRAFCFISGKPPTTFHRKPSKLCLTPSPKKSAWKQTGTVEKNKMILRGGLFCLLETSKSIFER